MNLGVLIADDDAGMRVVLRKIIENMEGVRLIGEAADGAEAVRLCAELKPDLIFLDVRMPVMDGAQAAKEISVILPDAALVFCTAHSEYMPDAFELYAADYLLKPFKTDRVRQTIRRVYETKVRSRVVPARTILIKNREGMTFVPVNGIILIYRENRLTYIETAEASYTTSESLNDLWGKLEGGDFYRSHRAFIINVPAISKVHPYGRWTYVVTLRGTKKTALITHEKLEDLQEYLKI